MMQPDHKDAVPVDELLKLYDALYPNCIDRKASNLVVAGDRVICIHMDKVEWEVTATELLVQAVTELLSTATKQLVVR